MSKRALIILYPKIDEGEVCVPYMILKRGGVQCTLAGPKTDAVVCSIGLRIFPDMSLSEALKQAPYDVVCFGGGRWGWQALSACKKIGSLMREQEKSGRLLACINSSQIAMKTHGIMYGRRLTAYPQIEDIMRRGDCYIYKQDDVVVDGNLITASGQKNSMHWAIKILEIITDKETAQRVAGEILLPY